MSKAKGDAYRTINRALDTIDGQARVSILLMALAGVAEEHGLTEEGLADLMTKARAAYREALAEVMTNRNDRALAIAAAALRAAKA